MPVIPRKHDYRFLAPYFLEFYKALASKGVAVKREMTQNSWDHFDALAEKKGAIVDNLMPGLGLTREQFEADFIRPYEKLDCEKAITLSHFQNLWLAGKDYRFQVIPTQPSDPALSWLVVDIMDLGLFNVLSLVGLDGLQLHPALHLPCHQCIYCGRIDGDELGKFQKNREKWFCCLKSCLGVAGKVEEHAGCCTREWRKIKSTLIRCLNRNYGSREKVIEVFKKFCKDRYSANAMKPPIRPWIIHQHQGCDGRLRLGQCEAMSSVDLSGFA